MTVAQQPGRATTGAPRTLVVQRAIPFFRQAIYRRLADRFETRFVYSGTQFESLPTATGLPLTVARTRRFPASPTPCLTWMNLSGLIREFRPDLVISECALSLASTWPLLLGRAQRKYRLLFWTHGYEDYWRTAPRMTAGDRLRKRWFAWSDAIIFYGERGCHEVAATIGEEQKLFVAPNTADAEALEAAYQAVGKDSRAVVRARLRFADGLNLVYLGRLIADKEVATLPRLMAAIWAKRPEARLHIIGGGPEEPSLRHAFAGRGDAVMFHGPITDPVVKTAYLYAADLLLSPGYLGLNVVDALACGCPVAYLDQRVLKRKHSPEEAYLRDGLDSLKGATAADLAERIAHAAAQAGELDRLREPARRTFGDRCGIEHQLAGILAAIAFAAALPPRRRRGSRSGGL